MSKIKINPKVKAPTLKTQQNYIDKNFYGDQLTDAQLKDMLRKLSQLSKESHWELYKFLIEIKGEKYVNTTGGGTFFNFSKMDTNNQKRFFDFVMLCVENEKREEVLNNADNEYKKNMDNLEKKLSR